MKRREQSSHLRTERVSDGGREGGSWEGGRREEESGKRGRRMRGEREGGRKETGWEKERTWNVGRLVFLLSSFHSSCPLALPPSSPLTLPPSSKGLSLEEELMGAVGSELLAPARTELDMLLKEKESWQVEKERLEKEREDARHSKETVERY